MKRVYILIYFLLCLTSISNAQYTKILDFAGVTNGSFPNGNLLYDGTFLYGMTYAGGTGTCGQYGIGCGVIFKIKPDGTGYVKLYDFASASGGQPIGSLISDGTFLYGVTSVGGANPACTDPYGCGVIFKIKPDGTGYTDMINFSNGNGQYAIGGSLLSNGTFLYGITRYGGTYGAGLIFKTNSDASIYDVLFSFSDTSGAIPLGSLISDGIFLYGMANAGGINNKGTIFKIKPDGTEFIKLLDFAGATNGQNPNGDLIFDGTFLYGMATSGGAYNLGTIFKIKPDGSGYSKLFDFAGAVNGGNPFGSLFSDGTFLYGMTQIGGVSERGTLFKIKPDGTGYTDLLNFNDTYGSSPNGSLISDGTFLYGMASSSGTNNKGTIFKYCITPVTFTQSPAICAGKSVIVGTHTYTTAGTYTDVLTSKQGCDSIITTNLTVNPLPTITANASAETVCAGSAVTLTGGGATSYVWTGGVTNGVAFIPTATTIYTVTGTDANNCSNAATKKITVNPLPTVIANASASTLCAGTMVTLTGGGASSYVWSGGVTNGTAFVPTATTIYTVTGTDANNCSNTATKKITVNPLPTVTANASASIVCIGTPVILTGGGAISYIWTSGITNGTAFVPTGTTIYTVTGTDANNCSNTATKKIIVNFLPAVTANASANTVCAGTTVILTGGGALSYVWSGGVTNGVAFIPPVTTIYTVTGTDANNCSNTATKKITVDPLPIITTHLNGVIITADQNGALYQWLDCGKNNSPIAGATDQSFTATINGDYAVLVTLNGCTGTSTCVSVNNIGIDKTVNSDNEFNVFPNPATNSVIINFSSAVKDELLVIIKNELGQTVYSENKKDFSGKYVNTIDLGKEAKGIYFVEIVLGNERSSKKIILE